MRSIYIVSLLILLGFCFSTKLHATGTDKFLEVDEAFQFSAEVNDTASVRLTWKINDGYSLYQNKFKFVSQTSGIETAAPAYPQGIPKLDKTFGTIQVYRNKLQLNLPLLQHQLDLDRFRLSVTYQGCADEGMCYMPVTKELTLNLTEPDSLGTEQSSGIFGPQALIADQDKIAESIYSHSFAFIFTCFLGFGLLLAFTPCVFPMIPIISGIIIGQGNGITPAKAFALSLSYVLASALTYMALGVIAGLFGSNLQAFFQEPAVIMGFSALFILLALSMFGFFSMQMPAAIQTKISILNARQKSGSWRGAAFMGVLSTLAVGPCVTAPLAGALIYIGKTGDAVLGGLALFGLGFGMGIPLLLIGTSAGKFLPKSGIWLDVTKAIFGLCLLAVAIWLLGRILPSAVTFQLWVILLLVPVLFLGLKKLWKAVSGIILIYGVFLLVGVFTQNERNYMEVLCNTAVACEAPSSLHFHKIKNIQELNESLAKAKSESRWVLFDLYADWCATCQEMKHTTFSDAQVKNALAGFILVQADVTNNDSRDKELLKQLNLIGPPSVLFFGTDSLERKNKRVIGYVNSDEFLRRIALLALH